MAKTKFRWTVILIAAALMVVQGCGSGSSSTTKADFVKAAEVVCNKGERQRSEVFNRLSQEYEGRKVGQDLREKAVLELIKPYKQQTIELGELTPPEGDERRVEAMVSAMEEGVSRAQANPAAVIGGDAPLKKANSLVVAYGLKHCQF